MNAEEVDPIVTGAVVKAADSAAAETSKGIWGLINRVLGPSADEWGANLQTKTQRRIANAEKFAEAAARTGADTAPGEVDPRIAHAVLEDGSLFDGEIAAEPHDLDSVERIKTVVAKFEIAAAGLNRLGLIDQFRYGVGAHDSGPWGQATSYFTPTAPGFELYGWAQGVPDMSARAFSTKAAVFDTEPPTARLQGAVLATPPSSQPDQT